MSVYLSSSVCNSLSLCMSVYLSSSVCNSLSMCMSVYLSSSVCNSLSLCMCVYLSVCNSLCVCVSVCVFPCCFVCIDWCATEESASGARRSCPDQQAREHDGEHCGEGSSGSGPGRLAQGAPGLHGLVHSRDLCQLLTAAVVLHQHSLHFSGCFFAVHLPWLWLDLMSFLLSSFSASFSSASFLSACCLA